MSPEIAQQVVLGITAVGVVVWLLSLNFLVKSARLMQPAKHEGFDESPAQKPLVGSAEVEGSGRQGRYVPGQRQLGAFEDHRESG